MTITRAPTRTIADLSDDERPSPAPPLAAISEPVGGGDFGDLR